jgi:hypothetical protein
MIRAVVKNGSIFPIDPIPPDWVEGFQVIVEDANPPPVEDLDEWFRELQDLGPALYEPGEREMVQAILNEADKQAKDIVRQQMGLV